ncbi:MAG: ribonuclease III [Verrucomicrobiae bacterium]|nr:ribonuclease III [Verrucomicrobiae bacterium]
MELLEEKIGYHFRDPALLQEALTHSSVLHEKRMAQQDNQRLEYLGDAVLQLLASEFLFHAYPEGKEGVLTQQRAHLVNRHAICELARHLDVGYALLLGKGEEADGGRERLSNLTDAMEAILGALYLDGGWLATAEFGERILKPFWQNYSQRVAPENPKGQLQEILQSQGLETPYYELTSAQGPDHRRDYTVSLKWRGREIGCGHGHSKKEAEVNAAAAALRDQSWLGSMGGSPVTDDSFDSEK